jgi:hypothetical protein
VALVLNDRVQETTTTTGTGTVTLAGALTGYQSFAAVGNGNTTYYCITDGTDFEIGLGTYTSSGTTLSRTTVLSSSNSGSLVNFSAGTKNVFVTYPSGKSVNLDASGNSTALGIPVSATLTNATGLPLTTGVTGNLPVTNLNSGTSASATTFWRGDGSWATPAGGSGTVTSVSVASANGFAGTVATATTTPAITVSTSITGVLKGNGTAISAATAGTDYQAPITLTTTGTSGAATFTSNTLNIPQYTGGGSATLTISNKTAAYTVVSGDLGTVINCTSGAFTVSLTAAATLGSGFNVTIWNSSSTATDVITIDPSGAETIEGQTTRLLRRGEGLQIVCDGTNWRTGNKKTMRGYAENFEGTSTPPIASGSAALALGVSSTASGGLSIAVGFGASSTSTYSTAIGVNSTGGGSQSVTSDGAMALGGSYASGTDSFAAAIANNTSSFGASSTNAIAIGKQAKATVASSIAIGNGVSATGAGGFCVAIGYQASATAAGAIAIGSQYNGAAACIASGESSVALGDELNSSARFSFSSGNGALAAHIGKEARASGYFAALGDAQAGAIVLRRATTDATAIALTSNAAAAGTTNQLILANNQAMIVTGTVLCRQSVAGSDKASGWTFTAVIRRGANAASTALVAAVTPVLAAQDVSLATTVLAVTADTTNGGLSVTVTGIAATNLRWVATLRSTEVTYA